MGRIIQSGFELNSTTTNVEISSVTGSPAIQTSTVRTGTYAGEITSLASATTKAFSFRFASAAGGGPYWFRAYFYFNSFPNATTTIIMPSSSTNFSSASVRLKVTTSGTLQLFVGTTKIGSDSSALSTGQWYCLEIHVDRSGASGSYVAEARINQAAVFASSSTLTSTNISAGFQSLILGGNVVGETATSGDWFIDDIAINDSTGSSQTSWCGSGGIVHLRPNAAGDNTTWTPLSGSNFANVSEVTPNDATDGVRAATAPHVDDYNIDNPPANLDASATVNAVQIGVRYDGGSATQANNPKFKVRFKASSGGTVSESAEIQPSATAYVSNANAAPFNPPLTLYLNPDSTTITNTTLTSSQVGVNLSTTGDGTTVSRASTLWVSVDYIASVGGGGSWTNTDAIFSGMNF